MNPRRLYRSRDRQLAGVAGGMAEYLNIDPTISRILWILAAIFTGGLVILAYIVLAIITPESPYAAGVGPAGVGPAGWAPPPSPASPAWSPASSQAWSPASSPASSPAWTVTAAAEAPAGQGTRGRRFGAAAIVGVVLIVIGGIALADAALPGWSSAVILGPAIILALGAALLVASIRRNDEPAAMPASPASPAAPVGQAEPGAPAADSTAWAAEPVVTDAGTDTQPLGPIPLA